MTKQTAKVVLFYQTGDASVLKLEEQALVKPGPGEVLFLFNFMIVKQAPFIDILSPTLTLWDNLPRSTVS